MTLQSRETNLVQPQLDSLIGELRHMIDQTRESIATTVNARMTMLYWQVGNRVRKEILNEERAEYGRSIVASVSRQLTLHYGKGFSEKSLRRMMQFGEIFPDEQIVASLLRQFLLELGVGFCFLARQKRIIIDNIDFHLDLLFYHRKLKRLVAIELKLGDFKPEHKGQMELYLRWLDKYERQPEEHPPLGLILCTGKQREQIELLELDQVGIHVAEYLTAFPSKEMLREKLQKAIEHAHQRLERESRGSNEE